MTIDWSNSKSKISKYFTVHEATWLPSWSIHHTPNDQEKANIVALAQKMDQVRDFIEKPITISVWIRPVKVNCQGFDPSKIKIDEKDPKKEIKEKALKELNYNLFIGGATKSAHQTGQAVDWVSTISCDKLRELLKPKLDEFKLRMEDINGPWVHLDDRWVEGGHNFFKP